MLPQALLAAAYAQEAAPKSWDALRALIEADDEHEFKLPPDGRLTATETIKIKRGRKIKIRGQGAWIDAERRHRFFDVAAGASLNLIGPMTLAHGEASNGNGGAIRAEDAELRLHEIVFYGNVVPGGYQGGAFYGSNSVLRIDSCKFEENHGGRGGAISIAGGASTTILATNFKGNVAANDGGALSAESSSANFTRSNFSSCTAGARGGAVALLQKSRFWSTASSFRLNRLSKSSAVGIDVFASAGSQATFEGCAPGANAEESTIQQLGGCCTLPSPMLGECAPLPSSWLDNIYVRGLYMPFMLFGGYFLYHSIVVRMLSSSTFRGSQSARLRRSPNRHRYSQVPSGNAVSSSASYSPATDVVHAHTNNFFTTSASTRRSRLKAGKGGEQDNDRDSAAV